MTTPLVFKAFNLIYKLNERGYAYTIKWDPLTRTLSYENRWKKLLPWHFANIGVVFLLHFCLPNFLLSHLRSVWGTSKSNKDILQIGAQGMIACHASANIGINILVWIHGRDFVHCFNALLRLESKVRGHFISSREIKSTTVLKELKPSKLLNEEEDALGLCMLSIIYILVVVPAVTPLSLVVEDVDPVGVFIKKVLCPDFDLMVWHFRFLVAFLRIVIVTIAMLEISQTFRTIFNFGLSVFHIYRKCMEVPTLVSWKGEATIRLYSQLQVLHAGMIGFFTPLGALFLGLNFVILTVSTVLCLVSYHILPVHIYAGIPGATAMAYFLLFATLPCAIHCHEATQDLILVWYRQVVSTDAVSLRHWKKVLRKLRPISFYCGSTGILTKETKSIYMASVINTTVNVLLWRDTPH